MIFCWEVKNMKKLAIGIACALALLSATSVSAAPNNENKAANNPNVVAFYNAPTDIHAIPTDPVTYVVGTNMVTTRGNNGQIQAWYTGADGHGIHSIWNVAKKGSCPSGWVLIEDAYPEWGDYLTPDTDYCAKVNSF